MVPALFRLRQVRVGAAGDTEGARPLIPPILYKLDVVRHVGVSMFLILESCRVLNINIWLPPCPKPTLASIARYD
jgi:hypothetical protein